MDRAFLERGGRERNVRRFRSFVRLTFCPVKVALGDFPEIPRPFSPSFLVVSMTHGLDGAKVRPNAIATSER